MNNATHLYNYFQHIFSIIIVYFNLHVFVLYNKKHEILLYSFNFIWTSDLFQLRVKFVIDSIRIISRKI
jgi:hypothetical protein